MKTTLKIIIILTTIIAFSNYTDSKVPEFKWYHFETMSGNFQNQIMPSKGGNVALLTSRYETYCLSKNAKKEQLYRTFKKEPFTFWKWHRYYSNEVYQFDYKSPSN